MSIRHLRWSPAYRKARQVVLATESACWLCGATRFVDIPRHPQSRTVDHVVPLEHGGHPFDRRNLRLAHLSCNSARGTGRTTPAPPPLPPRSESW